MDDSWEMGIARSMTDAGLAGWAETDLMREFCAQVVAGGIPVTRAMCLIDTLHPVHEGRVFRWGRDQEAEPIIEYGRTNEGGQAEESWRRSPFYHLVQSGDSMLRRSI